MQNKMFWKNLTCELAPDELDFKQLNFSTWLFCLISDFKADSRIVLTC